MEFAWARQFCEKRGHEKIFRTFSDTALWVAVYRALESARPDALFSDPLARLLAGEHGFDMVQKIPQGMSGAWTVIARTVQFDEWILSAAKKVKNVVNLAAGLDTRPYRLDLPADLNWLEIDFPQIIDYKMATLRQAKARCQWSTHACDLSHSDERKSHDAKNFGFARVYLAYHRRTFGLFAGQ